MNFSPSRSAAIFESARSADRGAAQAKRMRRGFTLVELMVVFVIVTILAGLSLAGLAGSRQRARFDKTRTTIRKISEAIGPTYESYFRRRVTLTQNIPNRRALASQKLSAIRTQMAYEMPDTWADIFNNGASGVVGSVLALNAARATTGPIVVPTASMLAYADYKKNAVTWAKSNPLFDSAECLYMNLARSGLQPDIMEQFHSAEIGDKDGDGAPEFWDGWENPISFLRWAPGFSSPVQNSTTPDPMDPQKADPNGSYALIPLIVSSGPDGLLGLATIDTVSSTGWIGLGVNQLFSAQGKGVGTPDSVPAQDSLDNVTNHDLITK
jgi:prepilin-type N-terminal cleavage/methylation domain-containing protein